VTSPDDGDELITVLLYGPDGQEAEPIEAEIEVIAPSNRRILDASTGHLPQDVCDDLNGFDGVVAHRVLFAGDGSMAGWLLWVPNDPIAHAADHNDDGDFPTEVTVLQTWARAAGCDYVLLDPDGDRIHGLHHWEW